MIAASSASSAAESSSQQSEQQILLVLEIAVERAFAHLRLRAHLIDGEITEPAHGRAAPRRVNQQLSALEASLGTELGHVQKVIHTSRIETDESV